jgi:RNA polymerase sigma-70 factor (ECF subfamily)
VVASDAEVIARVVAGDTDAFSIIVDRYGSRAVRYATRMLGDRAEAEEAVQDTFVRAYRAIARCADRDRFGHWLFSILINRCRTAGGRSGRRARTFVRDESALVAAAAPDVFEGVAWREEIAHALARLDVSQREAFLLKHVEQLSYEEMAEITGAGISALKMRVKRATDQLRTLLHEAYSA